MPLATLERHRQQSILGWETSHANKVHLLEGWRTEGYFIDYVWSGNVKERFRVRFAPGEAYQTCQSILEDYVARFQGPGQKEQT